jgi:uncharacterized protein
MTSIVPASCSGSTLHSGPEMPTIALGQGPDGVAKVDLDVLLRTRLLIQANSGGGKSWLLRRLAEQLFGHVPVLIIDPEGEFATLRERLDYVLVGPAGETPADIRSAPALARKLLELGASAVCDLYEMDNDERHAWVAAFLSALIDAPKTLWRDVVVMVDEAHLFAPEKGAGESVATNAMLSLATRGRKRGYCAIYATQRLGKLKKDAAAELQNVLVGQTFIDIDRERAAAALGIPRGQLRKFYEQIKTMPPGRFFGFGRAISTDPILVRVGPVRTTHPEPGSSPHGAAPPPAPDAIRHLLPQLADLPRVAAVEARNEGELRRELDRVRHALDEAISKPPQVEVQRILYVPPRVQDEIDKLESDGRDQLQRVQQLQGFIQTFTRDLGSSTPPPGVPERTATKWPSSTTHGLLPDLPAAILKSLAEHQPAPLTQNDIARLTETSAKGPELRRCLAQLAMFRMVTAHGRDYAITEAGLAAHGAQAFPPAPPTAARTSTALLPPAPAPKVARANGEFPRGARAILQALAARHPTPLKRTQIATLVRMAPKGSTLRTYLGKLATAGLVTRSDDDYAITSTGLATAGPNRQLTSAAELVAMWRGKLTGKAKDMLEFLAAEHGPLMSQAIAERLGLDPTGSTFRTYLGHLRANGLVRKTTGGFVVADELRL